MTTGDLCDDHTEISKIVHVFIIQTNLYSLIGLEIANIYTNILEYYKKTMYIHTPKLNY